MTHGPIVAVVLAVAAVAAVAARGAAPQADVDGPPIHFRAELSADEQSAVVDSPARGRADFVLERRTLRLSWRISWQGLRGAPVRVALHGPQTPGGEAGVLVDLASRSALRPPLEGSVVLDEGQLKFLLLGRVYVNLTSRRFPAGELRGQVLRLRSAPLDVSRVDPAGAPAANLHTNVPLRLPAARSP